MENIDFYKQYHTHPVNKIIHFFCIPTIAFCFLNYLSLFRIDIIYDARRNVYPPLVELASLSGDIIITLFYCYYYSPLYWSNTISGIMTLFYLMLFGAADEFRYNNINWLRLTHILFVSAWILQFIGHYIEGSRPALSDSVSQAFLTAPAFAILEPMGFI
jgi:uncharacterized membrane protein YGL010W